jgi:hypothetical protein
MNTITFLLKNLVSSISAHTLFRNYITVLMFALVSLTSCSDDDDGPNPDLAKAVGSYSVVDTDEDGDIENYSINITKSKDGGLEINNFGDIMYVPVKASIKGNSFTVPSQTFKGKSMTIVVAGTGTLNGNTLNFDYTIKTDDDYLLEHSCVANKNP